MLVVALSSYAVLIPDTARAARAWLHTICQQPSAQMQECIEIGFAGKGENKADALCKDRTWRSAFVGREEAHSKR
eukprot:3938739-Rhodomonas_salina.2